VKVADMTATTHNPFDETHWASCLRENLTSSSYGEGVETDRASAKVPRQSLTRQLFFKALKQNLKIKAFVGTTSNAVKTQVWTALITMLMLRFMQLKSQWGWSLSNLVALLRMNLFTHRSMGLAQQSTRRSPRSRSATTGRDEVLTWTASGGSVYGRRQNPSSYPGKIPIVMLDLRQFGQQCLILRIAPGRRRGFYCPLVRRDGLGEATEESFSIMGNARKAKRRAGARRTTTLRRPRPRAGGVAKSHGPCRA
jgi:hypothetical protein